MASSDGASRSHSLNTPNSVGLPWMKDQPHAETSTWEHATFTRDKLPCPRRDSNPQSQQPRDHWNRQNTQYQITEEGSRCPCQNVTQIREYEERSAVFLLFVLQRWLMVAEHFIFTSNTLCQYYLSLYLSNRNSCLYSWWNETEMKPTCSREIIPLCGPQQRVTYHTLHALSLKETRRHKCSVSEFQTVLF
jgi:hypothetical protein